MSKSNAAAERTTDAVRDTIDFRDRLYVPTLVEVPPRITLDEYRASQVPILDQGTEGACTGFGLASVAHYLLRRRRVEPDQTGVSARMFYEMAKRYDEWPGEEYSGSSARGAIKAWHKHGVCSDGAWPYAPGTSDTALTPERALDALNRPLGAYFRVNHKDLVAMHSAISEVGVLYATAQVHAGWQKIGKDGSIPYTRKPLGGHAFAIVGYDREGFWIQNSWGSGWGVGGFARIGYADWFESGFDVWVVRLGAVARLDQPQATAAMRADAPQAYESYVYCALRPHIVTVGNDGELRSTGTYGLDPAALRNIVQTEIPKTMEKWPQKRLLLYAHGGLVGEAGAVQRVADYRKPLLDAGVYPLSMIWRSDAWTTITNILEDTVGRRRPEQPVGNALDFMLDRVDDTLEVVARLGGGKAMWDEMKENALLASSARKGAARLVAGEVAALAGASAGLELHIACHSAGSIFMAPLVQLLASPGKIPNGPMKGETGLGLKIDSLTFWAPAISIDLFKETYLPLIEAGRIGGVRLYTLTDGVEQDDNCARIYNKSLLYLVAHAFEKKARTPLGSSRGTPLLGLERDVTGDAELSALFKKTGAEWIRCPDRDGGSLSTARRHGDFDDDPSTLASTLAFISRAATRRSGVEKFDFRASSSSRLERRRSLGLTQAAR